LIIANGIKTIVTAKITVNEFIPNHNIAINNQPTPENEFRNGVSRWSIKTSKCALYNGRREKKVPTQKAIKIEAII